MTDQRPDSPDVLQRPDPRAAGVRRLNRVPFMIALAILALVTAAVFYTYWQRLQQANAAKNRSDSQIGVLANAPDAGFIRPKAAESVPVLAAPPPAPAPAPELPKVNPYQHEWEEFMQRLARMRQAREQLNIAALDAPSSVHASLPKPPAAASESGQLLPGGSGSATEAFTKYAMDRLGQMDGSGADLNRQKDKIDFASEAGPRGAVQNTLQAGREAPRTPYELRAGAVIPAVMVGGVNSDMPGQLQAQVSANVYDTATGTRILIPQGSKLMGTYDSRVTTGQERVLVAWTRIIFPDASAIDIGRMPGADEDGYGGFHDQVNDHFWKVWSNALFLSAFSAGIQLSQGGGNNQTSGLTATQTVAASTGQQMGQLGMEIARRGLQIQPTLEIRPGYRFAVQVTKDILLRRWAPKDHATAFIGGMPYREGVQQR